MDSIKTTQSNFLCHRRTFWITAKQNRVFRDIATYVRQDQQYGGDHPERIIGVRVSHGFFRLFGVQPMLGRKFTQGRNPPAARQTL